MAKPLFFCLGVLICMTGCANDRRFDAIEPESAVVTIEGTLGRVGHGFFVSPDGTIVTSSRVVGDAHSAKITTSTGQVMESHVVESDAEAEIAVLKVTSPQKGQEFRILHLDDTDAMPGMHVRVVSGRGITQGVFDHWEDFGRSVRSLGRLRPVDRFHRQVRAERRRRTAAGG